MCMEKYVLLVKQVLFKEHQNSIQDEHRPKIVRTPEMVDSVYALILADKKVRMEDISEQLGISVGTIQNYV